MTFPATPLPVTIELYLNGAWTDVSSDVRSSAMVNVTRGRSAEGRQADPGSMSLSLNNRLGKYSPRNPNGTYFGQLGRNTPIRCSVENGQPRLRNSASGDWFSTPDSAGISVTGDIDLRADVVLKTWRPTASHYLGVWKSNSYGLFLGPDGTLTLIWYQGAVAKTATSTERLPGSATGRHSIRATLDVDNGAGGRTIRFYYSSDNTMDGTWIEFGGPVVTAGITSIDDTATALATSTTGPGEVNEIRVYQGIAGTKRASPKFTAQTSGTTSFADAEGNTWTPAGTAALDNRHYRFWGSVPAWPQKWDTTGRDVWVPIECAGILRRLGQGHSPTPSAFRRGCEALGSALTAYWPLEDQAGSSTMASGLPGGRVGGVIGAPTLAAYSGFVASAPLPTMQSGRFYLPVAHYTNTDQVQVRFLANIPSTTPNGAVLARIHTDNSLGWCELAYGTGGSLSLQIYTNLGTAGTIIGPAGFGIDDAPCRISIELNKNGAGVDMKLVVLKVSDVLIGGGFVSGNSPSITLGSCTGVYLNPNGAALADLAIGHVTVESSITTLFDLALQEIGYAGENASARALRLPAENGVPMDLIGWGDRSAFLGPQPRSDFLTLAREWEASDSGILAEQRDGDALSYRTGVSLARQDPVMTLSYADGALAVFEPVDDDQNIRNKITVTRDGGSSATVEDTTSALSTQDPPSGVGVYDEAVTRSLYTDAQVPNQAGWEVHLGTVDEARYPRIGVNLAHPFYVADPALTRQLLTAEVGDRIVVTDPPAWMPPEDADQLIQGYSERFAQFEHSITFVCAPARPYNIGSWDSTTTGLTRWDHGASTLYGAHDSTTTSFYVAWTTGPRWAHDDGDFDLMVDGERVTCTAVTGTTSPQVLTVTRSVNGVVRAHSHGVAVALFDPSYLGL